MNKKSQIAMEYLMTYGWAIMIVLTAVAALAYFGVLNPKNLLPDRTVFSAPVSNLDNAVLDVTGHTIDIAYQNNKGVPIIIPRSTKLLNYPQCADGEIQSVTGINHIDIPATQEIQNGEKFLITWKCPTATQKAGDRITADVIFDYKNSETGQTLKQTGYIDAKWT